MGKDEPQYYSHHISYNINSYVGFFSAHYILLRNAKVLLFFELCNSLRHFFVFKMHYFTKDQRLRMHYLAIRQIFKCIILRYCEEITGRHSAKSVFFLWIWRKVYVFYGYAAERNRFTGSYFSKMIAYCVDARWGRV